MAIDDFYKACIRKRPTISQNDYGEPIKTFSNKTIYGYWEGASSNNQYSEGGRWAISTQLTFLTSESDIIRNDIIVLDSENFRIIGRNTDGGNKGHHYEVLLERVDNID